MPILEHQGRVGGGVERQLTGCGWLIVRQIGTTRPRAAVRCWSCRGACGCGCTVAGLPHPVLETECELPFPFISFVSRDGTELREAGVVFDSQRPRAE